MANNGAPLADLDPPETNFNVSIPCCESIFGKLNPSFREEEQFSTQAGRAFAVLWVLAGTICLAQLFLCITELDTESRHKTNCQIGLYMEDMELLGVEKLEVDQSAETRLWEVAIVILGETMLIKPFMLEEMEFADIKPQPMVGPYQSTMSSQTQIPNSAPSVPPV
ncbi:hypothetical protein VNO77_43144 [Canavalia gladiata]|uniref:Uncharacterized protein n=1 Tax=Canavalia gladiata TaxID=3824 RepID=A0AAN9JWJ6_CANGL